MAHSYLIPAVVALVAYWLISTFRSWYRLRHFPGPFLGSISYLWMAKTAFSGKSPLILHQTQTKYKNSLVRIGPNDLIAGSATVLRQVNAARSNFRRDLQYETFCPDPDNLFMFSILDEDVHNDLKARTAPAYAGKAVPTLEPDIDEQLVALKNLIREKYTTTPGSFKPMNMGKVIPWFTLDSITKLSFGKEWGHSVADDDVKGFVHAVEDYAPFVSLCADTPPLRKIVFSKPMLRLIGPKDTDPTGMGYISGLGKRVVQERFDLENPAEKQDMLGSFIRHGVSQRACETEITLLLLAGSETTAGTLKCTIFHILSTPHVYRRLQAELVEAVAQGKVSRPVISYSEAQRLPYLRAVIYEGIRIQPSLILLAAKVVGPGGETLDGQFVPEGTRINNNIWSVMRNKEVFGEDVEAFRPERFLEAGEKKRIEMERDVEMLFGHGRYMCAGKMIGFMELNKCLFELFYDFDFQFVNSRERWKFWYYSGVRMEDYWVRVTERAQ